MLSDHIQTQGVFLAADFRATSTSSVIELKKAVAMHLHDLIASQIPQDASALESLFFLLFGLEGFSPGHLVLFVLDHVSAYVVSHYFVVFTSSLSL